MNLRHIELDNRVHLVKLQGELDARGTAQIERELGACCAVCETRLVIDMSDVKFMSSLGMRLLVRSAQELVRRGGHICLVSPAPLMKDKLELTGIASIIPIYDTLVQAEFALLLS